MEISEINKKITDIPFQKYSGIELVSFGPGWAKSKFTVTEDHLNAIGVLHGGIINAMLDVACFLAVMTKLKDNKFATTHTSTFTNLRPIKLGSVVEIHSELEGIGKHTAFLKAEAFVNGKKSATASVCKSIIDRQ